MILTKLFTDAQENYPVQFETIVIVLKTDLAALCTKLAQADSIAISVQGTDIDPVLSACAGISIAYTHDQVYFIPRHNNENVDSLSLADVIECLQPIFVHESIEKIFYHATFDQIVLQRYGMPIIGKVFDITIAAELIAHQYQEFDIVSLHNFYTQKAIEHKNSSDIPLIEHCLQEKITQAHISLLLHKILHNQLIEQNIIDQFTSLEMPIHQILIDMQIKGIACNNKIIKKIEKFTHTKLDEYLYEINNYSQTPIDINNQSQLRSFIFDTLKLPGKRKIMTLEKNHERNYDPLDEIIKKLVEQHPVIQQIIDYRALWNFKQNVLDFIPKYLNEETQRIHAFWQQSIDNNNVITSTHPDFNSFPIQPFDNKLSIRQAFQSDDNYSLFVIENQTNNTIKTLLLDITHEINQFKGNILLITGNQIIFQAPDQHKEKLQTLFPQGKIGKNWQEIS